MDELLEQGRQEGQPLQLPSRWATSMATQRRWLLWRAFAVYWRSPQYSEWHQPAHASARGQQQLVQCFSLMPAPHPTHPTPPAPPPPPIHPPHTPNIPAPQTLCAWRCRWWWRWCMGLPTWERAGWTPRGWRWPQCRTSWVSGWVGGWASESVGHWAWKCVVGWVGKQPVGCRLGSCWEGQQSRALHRGVCGV